MNVEVGQRVRLTIRELGRPADDLRYLFRLGKYADPKYGPTMNGKTLEVAGVLDSGYVKLQQPDKPGLMVYLADPSEIEAES